jgi:saccharopine dehydrogenase-like NADP-dependent oxidoreductase
VAVDGVGVSPRRLLGEMLVRHLPADEPDVVLILVAFRGRRARDGRAGALRYYIIDRFDERTGLSAMQRTTSFPASIIAQMMARGEILEKGAIPQERCVPHESFVRELEARNISILIAEADE